MAGLIILDWLLHCCVGSLMETGECVFALVSVLFFILPWLTLKSQWLAEELSKDDRNCYYCHDSRNPTDHLGCCRFDKPGTNTSGHQRPAHPGQRPPIPINLKERKV